MEHHSIAEIDVCNVSSITLESATGATIDDDIGIESLDSSERSHTRCLASYEVRAMLLAIEHYVKSGIKYLGGV